MRAHLGDHTATTHAEALAGLLDAGTGVADTHSTLSGELVGVDGGRRVCVVAGGDGGGHHCSGEWGEIYSWCCFVQLSLGRLKC